METNTHYTGNGRLMGPALSFTYGRGDVALERAGLNHKCDISRRIDCSAVLNTVGGCPTASHAAKFEI